MTTKSQQLQIRVTPRQKSLLKRLAAAAGQDVSTYVLSRAVPDAGLRFEELARELTDAARDDVPYILSEIHDVLAGIGAAELAALPGSGLRDADALWQNYVAAMVEHAARLKGATPPRWAADVPQLQEPWFATPLASLRPHLLRSSPVAFRRRNLFVDATVGERV